MFVTEIVATHADIEALKPQWNDLLKSSASDTVFLTSEWLDCWLKTVGAASQPFVVVVKDNGHIVALAPLITVQYRETVMPVRRLQFIGAPHADYADFIVVGDRESCVRAIFACLLEHAREWDFVELLHIADVSPNWQTLLAMLDATGLPYTVSKWSVCPYIRLGTPFEDYLRSLPKSLRYDLRRGEQSLRDMGELQYELLCDGDLRKDAFPHFLEMLGRRESATARSGSPSGEKIRRLFLGALLEDEKAAHLVHFSRLTLNRQDLAYHLGFEYGGKLYWYKPVFEPRYGKYSPGKILIKYAIKYADSVGVSELDFLLGDEPYKFQWTNTARTSYNIRLFGENGKARVLRTWLDRIKPSVRRMAGITNVLNHLRGTGKAIL